MKRDARTHSTTGAERAVVAVDGHMRNILIVIIVALTMGGGAALMPAPKLLYAFQDDAFYYLETARHVANGDGFTFDGVHRTNGFHSLWMFTLIPIVRTLPGDTLPLRAMIVLQVLLIALAAIKLDALVRPRLGKYAALAAVLIPVALPGAQSILGGGMESSLLFFLVVRVLAAWLSVSQQDAGLREWFILGLWCALAFLARLEAGLLVPLIALLAHSHWRRRPAVLLALLALPITIGLGYALWNRSVFGVWIPMSGMVKMSPALDSRLGAPMSYFERLFWSLRPLFGEATNPHIERIVRVLFFVTVFGGLIVAAVAHRRLWRSLRESELHAPLLMCVLLWLAAGASRRMAPWYPVAMLLVVALLVGAFLRYTPRLAWIVSVGLVALGLGRGILDSWRQLRRGDNMEAAIADTARWARDHIAEGDRIGSWNAGMFAWLSHRTVINLDGLMNDERFYSRVIVGHDLKGYTEDECIRWFADLVDPEKPGRPTFGLTTDDTLPIPMRPAYVRTVRANSVLAAAIWHNEDPTVCRGRP